MFENNRWLHKEMEQPLDAITVVRRLRMGCPGHDTGRQSDHPQACAASFESSLQMGNKLKRTSVLISIVRLIEIGTETNLVKVSCHFFCKIRLLYTF